MKQKIILAAFIALTLTCQLVAAGSITDTYTTGDTLTATKMDNIKAAVNDNDSRIGAARTTVTVNEIAPNIAAGSFGCLVVSCPVSHPIAIGGGVDLDNVLTMAVTQSAPGINGNRPVLTADGTYDNASNEWRGCARNDGGLPDFFAVAVICSDK